jgi:thioredoxin-like negative regulator of GroEL
MFSDLLEIKDLSELMILKTRQSPLYVYVGIEACIPCQNVKLAIKSENNMQIHAIDLKKIPKCRHLLEIDAVPTLIVYDNGLELKKITGEKNIIDFLSNIRY